LQNRLKIIYQLQLIDDQLDELEELRGDLPNTVKELEGKIDRVKEDISNMEKEQKESLKKRDRNELDIEKLIENQKKFKSQLYQVRNNKEYDALTKEIDHTESQIEKLTAENDSLADLSKSLTVQVEDIKPMLDELNQQLKESKSNLKEIIKANEKEETKLLSKRKKIVGEVKKSDISAYMRIRKAKKGKAIATIKRSACSGCHNVVPSQRQLEIRQNNKLYLCEYCGRILVSNEITQLAEE
jgi:predicted  nucleic acid-binding Zn-ribbon protein